MADNKNNNKKYLAIIVQYKAIDSIKTTYGFVLKKLSESFDQIYFINCEKLELFYKKSKVNHYKYPKWERIFLLHAIIP